jgi:hypothetical protein
VTGGREQAGRPTAGEQYDALRAKGEFTGWTGFCTVPDYCTTACVDCRREGELSRQVAEGER